MISAPPSGAQERHLSWTGVPRRVWRVLGPPARAPRPQGALPSVRGPAAGLFIPDFRVNAKEASCARSDAERHLGRQCGAPCLPHLSESHS